MNRPLEEIQVVDRHSATYSASRPSSSGAATAMRGNAESVLRALGIPGTVISAVEAKRAHPIQNRIFVISKRASRRHLSRDLQSIAGAARRLMREQLLVL